MFHGLASIRYRRNVSVLLRLSVAVSTFSVLLLATAFFRLSLIAHNNLIYTKTEIENWGATRYITLEIDPRQILRRNVT